MFNLQFITSFDPLEQFDVLAITGAPLYVTNLTALLAVNFLVLSFAAASYDYRVVSSYDLGLRSAFSLARSIVKENLYIQKQQYFSVLFYLFLTILLANMVGLLPYSFTITSSFIFTLFLSLGHFLGINLQGAVIHQWKLADLFLPTGAPLAISPFLILIETVSYIARIFSLSIRLFANMMSGHALLKILIGFSFALLTSGILVVLAPFPWIIVTAIMFLELLIAFLQAYVFVILVTLYINDVLTFH